MLEMYTLQELLYFDVNPRIVKWFDVRTVYIWFDGL